MARALIITVGTGRNRKDIAKSIARNSIEVLNPDHILFLCTTKSAEETIPHIREALSEAWHDRFEEPFCFDEADNIDKLFEAYRSAVLRFLQKNRLQPEDAFADFTSGTKPMSSALVLVAFALGLSRLNYIAGERDREGRTISGTERTLPLSPRRVLYDQKIREFKQTFDRYQYGAAQPILAPFTDDGPLEHRNEVAALLGLNEFYAAWDRYDLDAAANAKRTLDAFPLHEIVPVAVWNTYKEHRDLPGRIRQNRFDWMRLADLVENAFRRMRRHQFNDAMARLYRAVEFLAQARLYNEHSIDTGHVDLARVPENYHEQLAPYKNQKTEKIQIPMIRAYDLLEKLDDDLGAGFMQLYNDRKERLQALLNRRNESILAHGFESVSEDHTREMLAYIERLARVTDRNLEEDRQRVRFPRFTSTA